MLFKFELILNFLDKFSKDDQKLNFMKIRPVGAELLHTDRQADMTKQIVAFRNLRKAPKIIYKCASLVNIRL